VGDREGSEVDAAVVQVHDFDGCQLFLFGEGEARVVSCTFVMSSKYLDVRLEVMGLGTRRK
jgi:hypothetical protein